MNSPLLDKSVKLLLLVLLSVALLYLGKPFFVPFFIAALLSMLLLPLCARLEQKIKRPWAILLSVVLLLVVIGSVVFVISWQVSNISDNASEIEKNITKKANEVRTFATETLGIPKQKQEEIIAQQKESSSSRLSSLLSRLLPTLGGFLTNALIVTVYIFLFLLFRDRFRQFVLRLTPPADKTKAQTILHGIRHVSQKYLTGLAGMIGCLWVMYGIGFCLVGVENALFFAVLCGLLEIVPFVGNLTGVALTLLMVLAKDGSNSMFIGILAVYAVVQFTQSYLLEPLVVGKEISINPVFTIVGIVAGEMLWGIAGMVLALPLLGIVKIICDHIEPLKPYGFLIGEGKRG